MKLPKLRGRNWNYLALAFLFPFMGMLMFLIINGCIPFGDKSMLYSDAWHQYYPFFKAYRQALLSGDSLLYSWNVGMGMDYLGLISYYLASPLYLLSIFIPESWTLPFFSLLAPVRLGLAGLFFAIFLKKLFKKNDLSLPLFGCLYATCAWALGYQWNVMWLDTFTLLPLVALGTVSLLKEKRFFLYTLTLFLSIYANYYIGFFTCIFVLLVFICYQICRCKSFGRFFGDLGRIAFFSILAIGMTAILELPALAALQNTQSSVNTFPKGFALNITDLDTWKGLLDAMRQVAGNMGGGLKPTIIDGMPNLYCGVITIILAFFFLTTPSVKIRDKICSTVLLLFFIVSFIVRQLDYIWHGFHFTNQIPYRFSFLFSFVMLYMAYRAFLVRHKFQLWQLITAGVLALGIFLCSENRRDPIFLVYNLVFFFLYMFIFCYGQIGKKPKETATWEERKELCADRILRRKASSALLAGVMALEIILNLVNFGVNFTFTNISNYPHQTEHAASIIRYMKEREANNPFYRAEVTHSKTLNDGALNGYNGISTFTSSANVRVTEFMKDLGYGAKNTYNRYCFEESSPVSNLFLNLKYMIERDAQVEDNRYFDVVHHYGKVYLLENNAYLPLGFLAEKELTELNFDHATDDMVFQNRLFKAATGVSDTVWLINATPWGITGENVTIVNSMTNGYCNYTCNQNNAYVVYRLIANRSGFLCLDLSMPQRNTYYVYKRENGSEIDQYLFQETMSLNQTIAVGDVEAGDTITIKVACSPGKNGTLSIKNAVLNDEIFREGYENLAASTLEVTSFSNTRIEGYIDCNRDGLLYTSIPHDGNWHAIVDGKEAELTPVADAMVAFPLSEGHHEITFVYRNEAFALGWKISLGCLLIFGGLTYVVYFRKRLHYKGKYLNG